MVLVICRTLHYIWSSPHFIHLASPSLQSLSSSGGRTAEILMCLKTLTALTRLELRCYNFLNAAQATFLQKLALRELVLTECPEIQTYLSEADSFTALRKLHIEEECICEWMQGRQVILQAARKAAEGFVNRPHLYQISGNERFFSAEMRKALAKWHQSTFDEQTLEYHAYNPYHELSVYTRPWQKQSSCILTYGHLYQLQLQKQTRVKANL